MEELINLEKILNNVIDTVTKFGLKILLGVLILIVGIKLSKWFVGKIGKSKIFNSFDPHIAKFVQNILKIILYIVVVISVCGVIGVPYASFVAVLGSAGVAVALALQGSLSNIAAWILILINKPFVIGDFIEAGDVSGTVSDIRLFVTKIITVDNKLVSYPNSVLGNEKIINYSAMGKRRVDITFSVGYGSDIDKVKEVMVKTASAHPKVLKDPVPFARLMKHNDSSLDFVLRVWCKSENYWDLYFDMNELIKKEFDKNNIEIPFPKLDINISQKTRTEV